MTPPPQPRLPRPRAACAALATLLLAACAAGPDFRQPAPPPVRGYVAHSPAGTVAAPGTTGGDAQHFRHGGDVAGDWWTLFDSPALDRLVEEALRHNPDLAAAQAALRAAHENTLAQRGSFLPSVSAGVSASREKDPSGALAPVPSNNAYLYNLFTPSVSVSYAPDVFGLNRRGHESLQAQEQAVRFQAIATYNTLTANVAVAAIQLAATQAQLDATRKLVDINQHMLDILRYRQSQGAASLQDVAAQQAQLAQVRAALPALAKQQAQLRYQLAALVGRFPSEAPQQRFTLAGLKLPRELPLSLPSSLVAQRPDVRQAQANLHAASAQIGVAAASRLPQIQLGADAGSTALAIGKLFSAGTAFWNVAADVTAPIFEGGTLMHQERAARAAYDEAAAQYRSTVLAAFGDVANTLTALQQDAKSLRDNATAARAAQTSLDIARRQVRDGYAAPSALLDAEQAWQQAQINLVQAQASRYADTVALFQALGGGWWHRADTQRTSHEP
ncbi:efflux transporter outer membrane subunit [Fulvimonas sp. R45]|uniref:efflux transporter outer membrane subunit n=1 Tax=Fulvimonas sp. R45 TaxID=3045937 RepID=UPI00265DCF85|nr:efflux transporter outer membrane subunit [Fulvimonas sp. R45]MDO1527264.1 efflux transporter outer membrane subunit [Fulvimonas sp. R45]